MYENNTNPSNLPYFLIEQVGLYSDKKLSESNEEITEQCGCDDYEDTEEGEFQRKWSKED